MKLMLGDCLFQIKTVPDNSIDSVVTDPPYGLSFMGKKWDYDVPSVELWREVLRVLKPGGHVLSFGGTRTYHRMVVNIEDAGFEIRDQLQWLYGSGFPKSHNGAHGGTALKPANEPIVLARKPLIGTVAENVEAFGTGGLNIDASRIATSDNLNGGAYSPGIRKRNESAFGGGVGGGVMSGANTDFVQPQGRWPANILFDEEAAAVLDAQTGELGSGGSKRDSKKSELHGWTGTDNDRIKDAGGASRFFYVAKASKRERNAGLEGMEKKDPPGSKRSAPAEGRKSALGEARENHHPTVKPVKLMEYLVRLITPPGGIVLDPFMGSGTTGVAARNLGFEFIGCEMDPQYLEIAKRRIEHAVAMPKEEPLEQQLELLA